MRQLIFASMLLRSLSHDKSSRSRRFSLVVHRLVNAAKLPGISIGDLALKDRVVAMIVGAHRKVARVQYEQDSTGMSPTLQILNFALLVVIRLKYCNSHEIMLLANAQKTKL